MKRVIVINNLDVPGDSSTISQPKYRKITEYGLECLCSAISGIDFNMLYMFNCIDSMFEYFMNTIIWYIDAIFPLVHKPRKKMGTKYKGWITPFIIKQGEELKKLFIIFKNSNCDMYLSNLYKCKKKEHVKLIRTAKEKYFNDLINQSENKSKQIWNIVNSSIGKLKKPDRIILKQNDQEITDSESLAKIFALHYSSNITNLVKNYFGTNNNNNTNTYPIRSSSKNTFVYFEVSGAELFRSLLSII